VGIVRRPVLMGLRRSELPLEPFDAQLEEALRAHDVLQAELAQVAELEFGTLEVLDDPGCRVRDENLAAVRRGADSRGSMTPEPEVAAAVQVRLGGVEAHPDLEL